MKKTISVLFLSIFSFYYLNAQELLVGSDICNRYVWRGLDLGGKSPSIQPWMKFNFGNEKNAFTIGAWGAFSVAGTSNEETDLYFSYTYSNLITATITDYFFPGLNTGSKDKYFEWGKEDTGHILEGSIAFNGTDKIPFTLLFAVNLYGNDARRDNGDIFMSKYLEIGYKTKIKETDLNLFAGAALDNPEGTETAFYLNEKPGIINLGIKASRQIKITESFSLPVSCSFSANPALDKVYLVFGVSF
jgi:hypothetical protein